MLRTKYSHYNGQQMWSHPPIYISFHVAKSNVKLLVRFITGTAVTYYATHKSLKPFELKCCSN